MLEWLSTRRLFLVFNSRTNSIIEDYASPGALSRINLQPLEMSEANAVVAEMIALSKTDISSDELDRLTRTSDGNPYFLLELTKHWIETGGSDEVPPSVVEVLGDRISRISLEATQLLQACAILGENANLERLDQVLELPSHQMLEALEELTSTGMVRSGTAREGEEKILQVRHDLLANAALARLNPVSSRFIHRRCGVVLEREVLGPSISVSLLRACAFHWQQAGDGKRAYDLSMKCASYLLEIGLAADASAALEGVLTFCATNEQQIQVLLRIVEAHRLARDSAALLSTIRRVRALQNADHGKECHDDLEITELEALRISAPTVGSVFSRTLVCIYNPQLNPAHRVRVAVVALKLATSLTDLAEIERIHLELRDLLADDTIDLRSRLQVQVIYHTMVGDLNEAVRFAKERIAMERRNGSWLQLSNAIMDLAFVFRRTGSQAEVPRVLSEAYQIATSRKLFAVAREYAVRLADFLLESDRSAAEIWLSRADQSHGEPDQLQTACSATAVKARLALIDNRLADAERVVKEFPWDRLADRHTWRAAAIALRLRVHIAQRRPPDSVLRDVEELRDLYIRTSIVGGQDYEVSSLCRALNYVGDFTNAQRLLTDYVSNRRREVAPFSQDLRETLSIVGGMATTSVDVSEPGTYARQDQRLLPDDSAVYVNLESAPRDRPKDASLGML